MPDPRQGFGPPSRLSAPTGRRRVSMGLRDRVGDVRRTASAAFDTGTNAVRATGRGAAEVGGTAAAAARGTDDWVMEQLASVPPPVLPLTEKWRLSIGAMIARHPKEPALI